MRAHALLTLMMAILLVAPATAWGQETQKDEAAAQQADHTVTGGAAYGQDPSPTPRPIVEGSKAVRLPDGTAAAPSLAPPQVQEAIWAANEIIGKPYRYGGGHRRFRDSGYDCSGTISYALHGGGLLKSPLDSSAFMRWGKRGKGTWITVYTNPGHAFLEIAGLRLDTSAAGERRSSGRGPRWRDSLRRKRGFRAVHPKGY